MGDSPKIAAGRSLLSNMETEACADVDGITRTAAVRRQTLILLSSLDCVWCSALMYLNQRRHMYNSARLKGCNMLQVNPGMAAKHAAAAVRKTAEAAERSNWTSAKRLPQGAPDMPKPQCTASAGKSTYSPFLNTALSW